MKNDERYVKWIARHQKATSGSPEDRNIEYYPVRNCTDADFDKFYEPSKSSEHRIKKFRKNGGLYCIDFQNIDITLYSSWIYEEYFSAIDILAVPCGTKLPGDNAPIRDDCEWNRDTVLEYLGTLNLVIYYNQGVFQPNKYG